MKGAINYLKAIRDECRRVNGDCKICPYGSKRDVLENPCPRLVTPFVWDDGRINWMVTAPERIKNAESIGDGV